MPQYSFTSPNDTEKINHTYMKSWYFKMKSMDFEVDTCCSIVKFKFGFTFLTKSKYAGGPEIRWSKLSEILWYSVPVTRQIMTSSSIVESPDFFIRSFLAPALEVLLNDWSPDFLSPFNLGSEILSGNVLLVFILIDIGPFVGSKPQKL